MYERYDKNISYDEIHTYRHTVITDSLIRSGEDGWFVLEQSAFVRSDLKSSEVLLGQVHQLLVVDGTSSSDDESVGGVVGVDVRLKISLG